MNCLNVAFAENRLVLIFLLYVPNRIIVIIYVTFIEFSLLLGNGEGDVLYAEEILQPHLKAFPKVSYYIFIYLFTTTEWFKRTRKMFQ